MRGYKTNIPQFPIAGFYDDPKVGQAVSVLVERTDYKDRQGSEQFERWGHVFHITAVDLDAMTIELEAMSVNALKVMNRPLVHGEQRDAWGKTEFNVLDRRRALAATNLQDDR